MITNEYVVMFQPNHGVWMRSPLELDLKPFLILIKPHLFTKPPKMSNGQ